MTASYITSFAGRHAWLSNFHVSPVGYAVMSLGHGGAMVWTAEHAFQAHKAAQDPELEYRILNAPTPAAAKKLGRTAKLPPWWEFRKKAIMLDVLLAKFSLPDYHELLARTSPTVLIEGNHWGDTYWGAVKPGQKGWSSDLPWWHPNHSPDDTLAGENWLGRLLMMTRDVLT